MAQITSVPKLCLGPKVVLSAVKYGFGTLDVFIAYFAHIVVVYAVPCVRAKPRPNR